jgi:hypothetical protein
MLIVKFLAQLIITEIILVHNEDHMNTQTYRVGKTEAVRVKLSGTYTYHYVLKG